MLERSQRPLGDEDRRVLQRYRQNDIGTTGFVFTLLAGTGGFLVSFLYLGVFHWGDRDAPFWPIPGFAAIGAAVGFPVDYLSARKREAAAASRWGPVIAVGVVDHIVAEASKAVRLDDNQANTAWFLQVEEDQILCVWHWADDATGRVEVDLIPGSPPTPLKISWTGKKLAPLRPKRKFKRREREPELCEILNGTLEELDALLRRGGPAKREPTGPTPTAPATPSSKLADEVEPLGFYSTSLPTR